MDKRLKEIKSVVNSERIIMRQYRITIPKRFREKLELKDKSVLEARIEDGIIYLRVIRA